MQSRSRGNNLLSPPFQGHRPVTVTKLRQLVLVMAPGLLQGGGQPLSQDAHWLLRVSMPELCGTRRASRFSMLFLLLSVTGRWQRVGLKQHAFIFTTI